MHFNGLLLGTECLLVPLALAAYVVVSGDAVRRLIAMQMTATFGVLLIALLAIVYGEPSFVLLAIASGLLSIGGAFAYARFLERWL